MTEGKRGSRRGQRPVDAPTGASEPSPPGQIPLAEFPIKFRDTYLYDLHVARYPEHEANLAVQGGVVNVEVSQPLIAQQLMQVSVKIRASVPHEDAPAWSIEAIMNGVFEITEGTDSSLVHAFAQSNVLPLVWPYLRELFQDVSIRMRVPILMLNTLDLRQPTIPPLAKE